MDEKLKEIILDNRNLIYSIIHKFKGTDYDDLFQAGCLGIINAYKNFKPEYNIKFMTYAYPFIVGEIYKHQINNRNIHMSPVNIKLSNSIKKAYDKLTIHLGRYPTDDELCNFLEIDLYKLYEIRNMMNTESLDYEYEDGNLYDFIENKKISSDNLIDLKNAINCLSMSEKKFVRERYFNNITQSEMAKMYNTNQVKISREEKKILMKLREKVY